MPGPEEQIELLKASNAILEWFEKNHNPNEYLISWYKEGLYAVFVDQQSDLADNEWIKECTSYSEERGVIVNEELYAKILQTDIPNRAEGFIEGDLAVLAQTIITNYYDSIEDNCPFSYEEQLLIEENLSSGFRRICSEQLVSSLVNGYVKLLTNLFQAKIKALIEPITFSNSAKGEA